MASIQDVKLDILTTTEETVGKISLKLEFSNEELIRKEKYGLYTAIISDESDDMHVIASPFSMDEEMASEGHHDNMTWIDTRMIKPENDKILQLNIEQGLDQWSNHLSMDYRAVVYLIPENNTSFAWSSQQKIVV